MPIDANILLQAKPMNLAEAGNSFVNGLNAGTNIVNAKQDRQFRQQQFERQSKTQDIADQTNQEQLAQTKFSNLNEKQQATTKSMIIAAASLKPYIDNNDDQGVESSLSRRISQLNDLGIDSSDSQKSLEEFKANPELFKRNVNSAISVGAQLGILKNQKEEDANIGLKNAQAKEAEAKGNYYNNGGRTLGPNGSRAPAGYRYTPAGDLEAIPGGPKDPSSKPLPPTALKLQTEGLETIGTMQGINKDLEAISKQIDNGELKLGPVDNLIAKGRNYAGISDQASRNLASFKSVLEKQRNDSLRLNKGVQTEGDAQRAWNELFQNLNDENVVKQRLVEIRAINERGADLQKLNIDQIRSNYGASPLDYSQYDNRPSAIGAANQKQSSAQSQSSSVFQSPGGVKFSIIR